MGKKKDKASKSKKKKPESVAEVETGSESIQYAEYVTAEDVMELINSLEQGLDKLDKSNQLLKQQIAQQQKIPRRNSAALKVITIILAIGIIAVGYSSARLSARMDESMGTISADMDKLTSRVNIMNASIEPMNIDIKNINTGLNRMSADVSTINQNVNKVVDDVNKINTVTTNELYDSRRMGQPMYNTSTWR